MIAAVGFAVVAAASNALASVLQRRAARLLPEEKAFHLGLIVALIRQPVWLAGIGALIAGFVFQAAALSSGALALVQPVLVTELPFTMLLISRVFGVRLDRRSWLSVAAMTAGLTALLAGAAPGPGSRSPSPAVWVLAALVTAGTIVGLVVVAECFSGPARAAALGVAAGIGFAFTATFMKESTTLFRQDPGEIATSWEVYAMVVTGLCSLFLLQNALQSGPLVAAQPALTISDPVASILYGTMMYGEHVRTGPFITAEVAGVALIIYGSYLLSKSPPIRHAAEARPGRAS